MKKHYTLNLDSREVEKFRQKKGKYKLSAFVEYQIRRANQDISQVKKERKKLIEKLELVNMTLGQKHLTEEINNFFKTMKLALDTKNKTEQYGIVKNLFLMVFLRDIIGTNFTKYLDKGGVITND